MSVSPFVQFETISLAVAHHAFAHIHRVGFVESFFFKGVQGDFFIKKKFQILLLLSKINGFP